jgi:hypothetical protein
MLDNVFCARCGHEISSEARYCAHCGRAVIPLRYQISNKIRYILDDVSKWHIQLLCLMALLSIGVITEHYLVDRGLYFPASYAILLLVLGGGCSLIGWQWNRTSNRSRFLLVLVTGITISLLIPFVKVIDNTILNVIADSNRELIVNIPGVHLEASEGYKNFHSVNNPPPYWLLTIMFCGSISYLGHWLRNKIWNQLTPI